MSKKLEDIPIKTETVSLYAPQKKIYPKWVMGFFQKWRVFFVLLTQLVYFGTPWLTYGDRQAVLWDLEHRQFHFWNITIFPQDFVYLAALLMVSAFGLFTWTTIAGRLWCGYTCPQTVYTQIMLWFEEFFEGSYTKRKKRDAGPWNLEKIRVKTLSRGSMLLFSFMTGLTLVGYFTPIRELMAALPTWNYSTYESFWILFYGGFTYLLAGHMREQVCKYMCPYARFQSVMFDHDTLVISYDAGRGEPRGKAKKNDATPKGDCIDCGICVQVCPVGIDIRNGLQYECIGCAACIDGCDDVMDKIGKPRGLIRYTSEGVLQGQYTDGEWRQRLKRPRVILYATILMIITIAALSSFAMRNSFKVTVIKDRAALVRETNDGLLENAYIARISNTTNEAQEFTILAEGLPGLRVFTEPSNITLKAGEIATINLNVQVEPVNTIKGGNPITFIVQSKTTGNIDREDSVFIGE